MSCFGSISPIFRGPFMERVATGQHHKTLLELRDHFRAFSPPPSSDALLKEWFDYFYSILVDNYPCEYVHKNVIANDIYAHHQDSLISELNVANSRADVVILNGTSTVYEVKSEYDSFDRLDSQLADYRNVFDRIYVVTTPGKVDAIMKKIDPVVGVLVLMDDGKIERDKPARPNKENTSPAAIFDCMRKAEYSSAVKERFGYVPNVPNGIFYRETKNLFCQLAPSEAHDLMVRKIKKRKRERPFVDTIDSVPESLKHACLSFSRPKKMATKIKEKLKEPFQK